ncbi:MAG: CRISPR system precrRNA processing endoribonuclease RAMP protein Cas6 [Acidobacteria bacterium]|nr:CRISPR system precrRNA processing endoribonuclease RAMP protein Cas6 [Acidobacteriota bacterium]
MTLLSADSFSALNVARYRIRLRALESARWPAFAGSALRGAFGHALKSAVCVMPHRECHRCLVSSRCIYPNTFEPAFPAHLHEWKSEANAPVPYVLDPPVYQQRTVESVPATTEPASIAEPIAAAPNAPRRQSKWEQHHPLAAGEEIHFGLTLIGPAIEHLPFIVLAIHEMTQRGIGAPQSADRAHQPTVGKGLSEHVSSPTVRKGLPKRPQFALAEVAELDLHHQYRTLYTESDQRLESSAAATPTLGQWVAARLAELPASESVRVRFVTPTRIKVDDDLQPRADFQLLARNLLRRVSMLTAIYGGQKLELDYARILAVAADIRTAESALRWWDWRRYSARQQTPMKMGGFVGHAEFTGPLLAELLPLLAAGEILRIGKGTSFGLGKFQIEPAA